MINFVKKSKWFYSIAAVCMVVILGTAILFGVPMDIQFKGGSDVYKRQAQTLSSVYPCFYYITSGSIAPTFLCGITLD